MLTLALVFILVVGLSYRKLPVIEDTIEIVDTPMIGHVEEDRSIDRSDPVPGPIDEGAMIVQGVRSWSVMFPRNCFK